MKRRRHRPDPMTALQRRIRIAATQIEVPAVRRISAREADSIPQTKVEKAHGAKAKVLSQARCVLRSLPGLSPEELPEAKAVLLQCLDAINSQFYVVSETSLGERRRNRAA